MKYNVLCSYLSTFYIQFKLFVNICFLGQNKEKNLRIAHEISLTACAFERTDSNINY